MQDGRGLATAPQSGTSGLTRLPVKRHRELLPSDGQQKPETVLHLLWFTLFICEAQ